MHIVAIDDDHRMLLDPGPKSPAWSLPWAYHFLDLVYRCRAERVWKSSPLTSSALWWSLDEITSMELASRAKSARHGLATALAPRLTVLTKVS